MRKNKQRTGIFDLEDTQPISLLELNRLNNAPRPVDEYFFGTSDDRDEDTAEMRPYFYSFIVFSIALTVFMHVVI